MQVEIGRWEFSSSIQSFDSCSLGLAECDALFDWLEERIDDGVLGPLVCVGDWAIATCSFSLAELNNEHGAERFREPFGSWGEVAEAIAEDGLDGCYSDVIAVDDSAAVLVSL